MTKRLILVVLFLAGLGPIAAQDGSELQAITAQNVSTLVEIASLGEEDRNAQYTHIVFSPNGDYLIFDTTFQMAETRLEGNISVWQLDPLTQIAAFPGSVQGFIDDIQFSYCLENEIQYVFDLTLEDTVSQIPTGWCGIIDPSGNVVATGEGYYFYLHLRDAHTGEMLTDSEIPAIWQTFSADGSLLATSSILNEIALWDVAEILEVDKLTIDDALVGRLSST